MMKAMNVPKLMTSLLPLSKYHPVVIEGMGNYDPRDPDLVANHIYENLLRHWDDNDDAFSQQQRRRKPKIIVTQGDPLSEKGISAITPRVAKLLGNVPRCLIVLDDEIADYHSPNADRDNVVLEYKYSQLTSVLEEEGKLVVLNDKIDAILEEKNHKRTQVLNKPPLKDYFRDFARLQEVTKAACNILCGGDLTVAHTAKTISEFSVASFYQASLELELVHPDQMVPYQLEDELDFDLIDKR